MGILRRGFGLIDARDFRAILLAVVFGDERSGCSDGFIRKAKRIRTHVADETHAADAGNFHAFIELLGNRHGPPRRHVQAPGSLLLQCGSDKRRRRRALLLCLFDRNDRKRTRIDCLRHSRHFGFGLQFRLFSFFSPEAGAERSLFRRTLQKSIQQPVLLALKCADLILAVTDHTGCNRLDPSR